MLSGERGRMTTLLDMGYNKLLYYVLMSYKQRHKTEYFVSLKVAHDNFTWNCMKYHVWVGMVDTLERYWLKGFGCTSSIPAQYRV